MMFDWIAESERINKLPRISPLRAEFNRRNGDFVQAIEDLENGRRFAYPDAEYRLARSAQDAYHKAFSGQIDAIKRNPTKEIYKHEQ